MIFSYVFFLEQMAKHVLECFGMSNIWNIQLRDKWVPNSFEQNWKDQLQKLCLSENEESPKVLNYRIFKTEIKFENYVIIFCLHVLEMYFAKCNCNCQLRQEDDMVCLEMRDYATFTAQMILATNTIILCAVFYIWKTEIFNRKLLYKC